MTVLLTATHITGLCERETSMSVQYAINRTFFFNFASFLRVECRVEVGWKGGSRETGTRRHREGQELNNRMCFRNLDLETTAQTFMLRAHSSPLCASASVKRSSSWSCDESKNFNKFLVRESSSRVCLLEKQDGVSSDPATFSYAMKTYERACAHTKGDQIVWKRGFWGLTAEQVDLQFQAHRCTCRSWACLKLQCLCAKLRLGVVKTHSDVNSWPCRSPLYEHRLLSMLRDHFF